MQINQKKYYYYKINNDSTNNGLRLEIWCRRSKGKGTAYFVRTLPNASDLNDFLINYDSAVIIKNSLMKAVEQARSKGVNIYGAI